MKGGSKLFLVAGVGLAIVAIGLLVAGMSGGSKADGQEKKTNSTKITVVEAIVDLPPHTMIKPEDLLEVQVPTDQALPEAVQSKSEVVGLSYRLPLVKGQRLVRTQTETPGLGNEVTKGKRAVSVPVNAVGMLSGLVQDGDYVDVIFHARINLVRVLPSNVAYTPEDGPAYIFDQDTLVFLPPDIEAPNHPFTGDPGSQFAIRDDIGEQQQLEPVAKVLVQDAKVIRVVRPGQSFAAGGSLSEEPLVDGAPASDEEQPGYLILEVTPAQAEVLTFMQDTKHQYQIVVRGKDDHEIVTTEGVTFEILASDEEWALPWPESLTAPKQATTAKAKTPTPAATVTPAPAESGTPTAGS